MPDYPAAPAAFINAIAEEGTKAEAVTWLQKQWNETCYLRSAIKDIGIALARDEDIDGAMKIIAGLEK